VRHVVELKFSDAFLLSLVYIGL